MKSFVMTICCLACFNAVTFADEANKQKKAYMTADEAGPEFGIQGEYSGPIKVGDSEVRIGIQTIAEGNNKLAWVAYIGGLPGDGWDGNTPMRGAGVVEGTTDRKSVV